MSGGHGHDDHGHGGGGGDAKKSGPSTTKGAAGVMTGMLGMMFMGMFDGGGGGGHDNHGHH